MNKPLLICFLLLPALGVFSQSAFTGGKGDGYGMIELNPQAVSVTVRQMEALKLYPNVIQANGIFTLSGSKNNPSAWDLQILNAEGQLVYQEKVAELPHHCRVEQMAVGNYTVVVRNGRQSKALPIVVIE